MGLRKLYGLPPAPKDGVNDTGLTALVRLAHKAVSDPKEKERRRLAQERVDLFYEFTTDVLRTAAATIFKDRDVFKRLEPFLALSGHPSLFRRTIDEVAGPAYQIGPTRKVVVGEGERAPDKDATQKYRELAKLVHLDERFDLACHLGHACNSVFLIGRKPESIGTVVDLMTPAQITIITHPDDAHREAAYIYDTTHVEGTDVVKAHSYWDDEEGFLFTQGGQLIRRVTQPLRRMAIVPIHMTERPSGQYWDISSGNALVQASIAAGLLTALTLKLHKSQGFKQLVVAGDIVAFPKEQALDEENAILAPNGTTISTLDLTVPAGHYLTTLEDIVRRAAAQYGISLDRLNANASSDSSDVGLEERRADAIKVFRRAEENMFSLLCAMEPGTSPTTARLAVDYGELSLRTDPMGTLELWQEQISKGLRNELDNIRAMNPEIDSDEEAWTEFDRNLDIHAKAIERMRALNMTKDATPEMPGQDAQANGAMGPKVRDGEMTRDEAADAAENDATEDNE
jgi:hypothetical protein